jgi:hypothetical protein
MGKIITRITDLIRHVNDNGGPKFWTLVRTWDEELYKKTKKDVEYFSVQSGMESINVGFIGTEIAELSFYGILTGCNSRVKNEFFYQFSEDHWIFKTDNKQETEQRPIYFVFVKLKNPVTDEITIQSESLSDCATKYEALGRTISKAFHNNSGKELIISAYDVTVTYSGF